MFSVDMDILKSFAKRIEDNSVECSLFHRALSILNATNATNDVPRALESVCQVWQEIATLRNAVVAQSQTRTPITIAMDAVSSVPLLFSSGDDGGGDGSDDGGGDGGGGGSDGSDGGDSEQRRNVLNSNTTQQQHQQWKTLLDPACGSGLLVAMMMYRTVLNSNILLSSSTDDFTADMNADNNDSVVEKEEMKISQRRQLVDFCTHLSKSAHAMDVDEMSCMLTRVSMLCVLRPLLLLVSKQPCVACSGPEAKGSAASLIPPLTVVCANAPLLLLSLQSSMPTRSAISTLRKHYDIIIQNPPYRNMSREFRENKGRAFSFLSTKKLNLNNVDVTSSSPTDPWLNFLHHNLYGYFLELGRRMARPVVGVVTSVVLRNVFDLHKYPKDVNFHLMLLMNTTILRIRYNLLNSFDLLPHDARHTEGIATVTMTIRTSVPEKNHTIMVVRTQRIEKECEQLEHVLQENLLRDGLGVTDILLCEKYSYKILRKKWEELKCTMVP